MRIGAVFPQLEIGPDAAAVREYAQTVEALGFDYVLVYDHVLGANPDRTEGWNGRYTARDLFHETLILLGYFAGITERVELVSGILILPQRQAALVAKQAAEIDVLSRGRLRLGVGIGWNEIEYVGLGMNFRTRGRRIAEQVEVMRALWTAPLVNYEGDEHTIPDAGILPLPVQRPIPVWFGGRADAALRRMARIGDGWIANPLPHDQLATTLETLRGYVREAGRDPSAFGIDLRVDLSRKPEGGWKQVAEQSAAAGVTHLCLGTMDAGLTGLDQHLAALRQFIEEVRAQ